MKKNIILILSAFVLGTFVISCSKGDKGATGPAGLRGVNGPQGPAGVIGASGPIGQTGPVGPAGPAGTAGTASVTYSGWTTLTNWAAGGAVSARSYAFTPAPGITSSVISNGLVLAYFRNIVGLAASLNATPTGSTSVPVTVVPNQVFALPFSEVETKFYTNIGATGFSITYISEYTYSLGNAGFITYQHKSAGNLNWSAGNLNFAAIQARYVIIPGSIAGGRITSGPAAGYTVDQVKALNYSDAKSIFNLPEDGGNDK